MVEHCMTNTRSPEQWVTAVRQAGKDLEEARSALPQQVVIDIDNLGPEIASLKNPAWAVLIQELESVAQSQQPLRTTGGRSASERELRAMLATAYCGTELYSDDGELQDKRAVPCIDFLRDSPKTIRRKMRSRNYRKG